LRKIIIEVSPKDVTSFVKDAIEFQKLLDFWEKNKDPEKEQKESQDNEVLNSSSTSNHGFWIKLENFCLGILSNKGEKALYLTMKSWITDFNFHEGVVFENNTEDTWIFIGQQIEPFVFSNKSLIFKNDVSSIQYTNNKVNKLMKISLNKATKVYSEVDQDDNNYILLWDDYARFIAELVEHQTKCSNALKTIFKGNKAKDKHHGQSNHDASSSQALSSHGKPTRDKNNKHKVTTNNEETPKIEVLTPDFEVKEEGNTNKKSMSESEKEQKRQFIRDNAFIDCRFKEGVAQNRCEALLDFNLLDSFNLSISKLNITWLYKYAINEFDLLSKKKKNYIGSDINKLEFRQKTRSVSDLNDNSNISLELSAQNLMKIPDANNPFTKASNADTNEDLKIIESIIKDNLCFNIELSNVFIGLQKWNLNSQEERVKPWVDIVKIDLESLRLSVSENTNEYNLFISSKDYLLDVFVWNKHRPILEERNSETQKQVIQAFLEDIQIFMNNDVLSNIGKMTEEILATYKMISNFIPQSKNVVEKSDSVQVLRKDRKLKISTNRIDLIISESNLPDDFVYSKTHNKLYKSTVNRDVELYQLEHMTSDVNSIITGGLHQSAPPHIFDSKIDAICLGLSSINIRMESWKVWKDKTESEDEDNVKKPLELKCGIQSIYLSVCKNQNINIVYPTDAILSVKQSSLESTSFSISVYPIEIELSLELMLEIKVVIECLVKTSSPYMDRIKKLLHKDVDNQSLAPVVASKLTKEKYLLDSHKYSLLLDISDIILIILRENKTKARASLKYLPLWSLSLFNLKLESAIETITYELHDKSSQAHSENEITETKTLVISKEFTLSSTVELYYFNLRVNFYEPFIEEFDFKFMYKSDAESKLIAVEWAEIKPLDFNISTALVENIVITTAHFSEIWSKANNDENPSSVNESSAISIELSKNKLDTKYTLENSLGEDILVWTTKSEDSFQYIKASQTILLEFDKMQSSLSPEFSTRAGSINKFSIYKSPYRRENFRIDHKLQQQHKNIWIKIPSTELKADFSSFDDDSKHMNDEYVMIDIEKLEKQKSLKVFIDKTNNLFIYCYLSKSSSDQKHIILRSPLQINNDLKVPIEVRLIYQGRKNDNLQFARRFEVIENTKVKLSLEAGSTKIIPTNMSNVVQVQVRPLDIQKSENDKEESKVSNLLPADFNSSKSKYEWSELAEIDIQNTSEKHLFETPPFILKCNYVKDLAKDKEQTQNLKEVYLLMTLNNYCLNKASSGSDVFSISNSFKYISFNAPYTIVNSLPFDIRIFFNLSQAESENNLISDQNPNIAELIQSIEEHKQERATGKSLTSNNAISSGNKSNLKVELKPIEENKSDEDESEQSNEEFFDAVSFNKSPQKFEYIDLTSCKEVSLLDLNPVNQFSVSIQPTMYRASNFLNILMIELSNNSFIRSFINNEAEDIEDEKELEQEEVKHTEEDSIIDSEYKSKYSFRLLKKRTFIFQNTSLLYGQLNICWDVTSIHGFYKLHFYTKYWFLNNTELPLSICFEEDGYQYDEISLPYVSKNFDFEEIKSKEVKKGNSAIHKKFEAMRERIKNDQHLMDMMRVKPWERFNLYKTMNQGLLCVLDNNVNDAYFKYKPDEEREYGIFPDTLDSDDSIEQIKHDDNEELSEEEAKNHPQEITKEKSTIVDNMYDFPIDNSSDRSRIRLFSSLTKEDEPTKDSKFMMKIENSGSNGDSFDISCLQTLPELSLNSKSKENNKVLTSEYSIISSYELLPYPFSKTTLITFKSKYRVLNKCSVPIFITQADWDSSFCLFPHEKSIFHWTNNNKKKLVRIRIDYGISGLFAIDKISEFYIRIKNENDHSIMILNVTVQEIASSFLIEFTDGSYMPPYRIENMTKHSLVVTQSKSKNEDFDRIDPYQIIGWAFSHPLNDKVLKIAFESKELSEKYGVFANQLASVPLDSFKNTEIFEATDKRKRETYVISLHRERTMKIIRIQERTEFQFENEKKEEELHQRELTIEVKIPKLGISFINSSAAEELMYVYIKQIDVWFERTKAFKKFKLEILAAQIENQLAESEHCVVLKKDGGNNYWIFSMNYWLVNNEGFEHIIHFKELNLTLYPLQLFLESSFCVDLYIFFQKIFTTLSALAPKDAKQKTLRKLESKEFGNPPAKDGSAKQTIYFEYLYIDNIKIKFSFDNKPEFINQAHLNQTLKLIFVTLMNMKNVNLEFQAYIRAHYSQFFPLFLNNVKGHYLSEWYSQKQLTSVLLSIGILGTLKETFSNLSTALQLLIRNPNRNGNVVFGLGENLYNSSRYILYAVSNALTEAVGSIGQLYAYLNIFAHKAYKTILRREDILYLEARSKEDENSIKDELLQNMNSLVASLDSQNKIWLGFIILENTKLQHNKALIEGNHLKELNEQLENEPENQLAEEGKLDRWTKLI
jgi:hypothetical protein